MDYTRAIWLWCASGALIAMSHFLPPFCYGTAARPRIVRTNLFDEYFAEEFD